MTSVFGWLVDGLVAVLVYLFFRMFVWFVGWIDGSLNCCFVVFLFLLLFGLIWFGCVYVLGGGGGGAGLFFSDILLLMEVTCGF